MSRERRSRVCCSRNIHCWHKTADDGLVSHVTVRGVSILSLSDTQHRRLPPSPPPPPPPPPQSPAPPPPPPPAPPPPLPPPPPPPAAERATFQTTSSAPPMFVESRVTVLQYESAICAGRDDWALWPSYRTCRRCPDTGVPAALSPGDL